MLKKVLSTALLLAMSHSTQLHAVAGQDISNVGKNAIKVFPQAEVKNFYASDKDMQWFKEAKFGVFIHWSQSSVIGEELSWSRNGLTPDLKVNIQNRVPQKVYDNLYKKFNPNKFDADKWMKVFKESGAKYIIFTTKHHDGFCMFDAKNTEYKITNTPYGKDIARQIADAAHKYKMKLFWYYSQPDWTHKDYLTENHDKYREYMFEHLRQLLSDYGKIDGIWFDCLNTTWKHWNSPDMIKMIRKLQPGILINSRWGWGMPIAINGDFDNPEQELGRYEVNRPWESCITMGPTWGWSGAGKLMSADSCIKTLVQCVGAGGNLALNIGPRPDGAIEPQEIKNLKTIGNWLKKNGKAVYATKGGPYKPGVYGVTSRKKNKIFLHILAKMTTPKGLTLRFKNLPAKVLKAYELSSKKKVQFKANKDNITLDISNVKQDNSDTIIVLELDKDATNIETMDSSYKEIPVVDAKASSVYGNGYDIKGILTKGKGEFKAGIHQKKIWVAKSSTGKKQWVELDLGTTKTINALTLTEPKNRTLINSFSLQYYKDGAWVTFYKGDAIGVNFSLLFPKIKTSKIRLNISNFRQGDPGLEAFKVYE
jgi:alpha-L-fucosidase